MSNRDILLIFDIDETLLQFINKKSYHFWEETSDEEKLRKEKLRNKNNFLLKNIIFIIKYYLHKKSS